jgi:hypothetical protein
MQIMPIRAAKISKKASGERMSDRKRVSGWGSSTVVVCGLWLALIQSVVAQVTSLTTKLEALVNGSGYKINKVNDAAYTIDFTGKQLAKFKLIVNMVAKGTDGIIVVFTNPAEKAQIPNNTKIMSVLLKANGDFDYVKIGIDSEGDAFVRADIPATADSVYFKTVVEQVAAATDELYGKIKPLLK